jgi:hypothetical protein
MAQDVGRSGPNANLRLVLGLILGFVVGLAVGSITTWLWQGGDAVVLQKGVIDQAAGNGEYDVFYPRPFASPPNLKILPGSAKDWAIKITEQRADGFRVTINGWTIGGREKPEYEARGLLAKGRD